MKLGLSTGLFRWKYALEEAIKKTAEIGYNGVELWADRPHAWPKDYSKPQRKKLRELIATYDLEVPSICPWFADLNFASLNPVVRELTINQVKEAITMASDLEARIVLIVPGKLYVPGVPPPEKVWAFAVEGLKECAKYAENYDILLGIENIPETYFIVSAEDMLRMINEINYTNSGAYFDVANANPLGSPIGFIQKLGKRIVSVHLADNDGKSAAHLPPGQGNIDFQSIIRTLQKVGYDKYLIAEVFHPDPDFAAIKTRETLAKLL